MSTAKEQKPVKDFLGQEITAGSFIYYFKTLGKTKKPKFAYVERITENQSVMAREIHPTNSPTVSRVGAPQQALVINQRTLEYATLKKLGKA